MMNVLNYFEYSKIGSIRKSVSNTTNHIHRANNNTNKIDLSFLLSKLRCNFTDDHLTIGIRSNESGIDLNDEIAVPAFASKFSSTLGQEHILAVSNEEGIVNILNTNLTGDLTYLCTLPTHDNAVFDVCWVPQESQILTVSGDKTAALWDVEQEKKLAFFKGHTGSVKWADFRPNDKSVFATAARDGCIIIWDSRINKSGVYGIDNIIRKCHTVNNKTNTNKKNKPTSAIYSQEGSVTAAVFQDEFTLISSGSTDGSIKIWDIRKHYSNHRNIPLPKFTISHHSSNKHGYSSLLFDSRRLNLFASCCNNVIYQFDCSSYNSSPVALFTGHQNRTFFVKTAISPDDQYLLSGSSDGHAYIWKISEPSQPIYKLEGHQDEVTAVAWSTETVPKIATCGDDMRFKLWRVMTSEDERDPNIRHTEGRAVEIPKLQLKLKESLISPPSGAKSLRGRRLFTDTLSPGNLFETPDVSTISNSNTPSKRLKRRHQEQENEHGTKPLEITSGSSRIVLSPTKAIRNEENIRRKLAFESEESSSFTSPTINLPNSVLDQLSPITPPSTKKKTKQSNWLIQIGHQDKIKLTPKMKKATSRSTKRKLTKNTNIAKQNLKSNSPNITHYFSSPPSSFK